MDILRLTETDYLDSLAGAHYARKKAWGRRITQVHRHEFFEIFLVIEGSVHHQVNGANIHLPEGTLVFVRPDDAHCYAYDERGGSQFINLAFSRRVFQSLMDYLAEEQIPEELLLAHLPPCTLLNPGEKERVQAMLERMNALISQDTPLARAEFRLLVAELLIRYLLKPDKSLASEQPEWLRKICQAMQNPDNLRLGVQRLQELAELSPAHLSRTFKRCLNCTPTEYVNELRLQAAAYLLLSTNRPVADIAFEVGYLSLSYFYKRFKRRYDLPPEKYRRQFSTGLAAGER